MGGLRLTLLLLGGLGLGLGLRDTLRGGGLLLLDRLVTGLGLLLNGVCLGLMLMLLLMDGCRAGPGLSLLCSPEIGRAHV